VFASASLGTRRQALTATAISVVMVWWFFIPPERSIFAADPRAIVPCVAFSFTSALMILLQERVREATKRVQSVSDEARAFGDRLAALVAQAPDGVFAADLEGRYTDVNEAGCRMLGYTREELIGKTILDLVAPDQAERLWRSREALLKGGNEIAEWMLRKKDGSHVPVEINAWIMADGRWQAFVRDISVRRALEKSLADAAADLNRAQFVAEVGSWRLDVHKDELRWTDENYRIFGVAPGTRMTYEAFLACVHPEDRQYVDERWSAALRGEPYDIEHRLLVDGAVKWVREKADLWRDESGALVGGIGITQDLTARRRLEDALRLAIRSRDEVLAIVAHDLRGPLHSIVLQTGLLRRRGAEPERRTTKPLERVERAAKQMKLLIQDLIEISRIDAGHLAIEPARIPAQQVLEELVDAHEVRASEVGVSLGLEVHPGVPDVWADRDRLVRVFENLLSNSLKFTPSGGSISIGATPKEEEALFWVADTGIGIPAEHLAHIFDRFWQAREARKGGAGLGLAFVKGVVEAHGGRIWVESTPGRGSTFFFTFPTALATARKQREPGERPALR
jgi:PAS domain S-box-containing protein